jgi:hypothetical protein
MSREYRTGLSTVETKVITLKCPAQGKMSVMAMFPQLSHREGNGVQWLVVGQFESRERD